MDFGQEFHFSKKKKKKKKKKSNLGYVDDPNFRLQLNMKSLGGAESVFSGYVNRLVYSFVSEKGCLCTCTGSLEQKTIYWQKVPHKYILYIHKRLWQEKEVVKVKQRWKIAVAAFLLLLLESVCSLN